MTELASLAGEVGVHERTLRRALNEGTLRVARPSPRSLELSFAEALYIRRQWPLIAKLRAALRTERNVRFAMLFGSAARGQDTERSDVDVIADFRDSSLEPVLDLKAKLRNAVGRDVDIIRMEDAQDDPTFLAMALEDGRVLVDREKLWPRLRRREAALRLRGSELDERRKRAALARAERFLAAGAAGR